MTVICNNADRCNSTECTHKKEHPHDPKWCSPGNCRWAEGTRCVEDRVLKIMQIIGRQGCQIITIEEAAREIINLFNQPTNPDPQPEAHGSRLNQEEKNV